MGKPGGFDCNKSEISTEMTTRKDTWDPLTKSLIDQTEWQLSQKLGNPCYTELPVLDDVIKRVLETGIVVITGKAGDGKTTLGLSVLRHFHKVCYSTPINLLNSNPHELHKILMTDKNCVLLMDDIFGKTNFEIKRFERWQPMLEELHSYKGFGNPDMRSVFIVITLRSNIYFEAYAICGP